jgi:hypothetical protein
MGHGVNQLKPDPPIASRAASNKGPATSERSECFKWGVNHAIVQP